MAEFFLGETVDPKALDEFASLLRTAYDNGRDNGSHMDWNDVAAAKDKAVEAFGEDGSAFQAAADAGFEEEPQVTYPLDATWEIRAAASLLFAYRYPEDVAWEDVDAAWEILLQAEMETGAKPN